MDRKIIIYLVEGDDAPPLQVRFTGLKLSDYTSITMHILYEDGSKISRTVTPDGSDDELGTVTWQVGDLVRGEHWAEFEFVSSEKIFTLPQRRPIMLKVRADLG